jgi:hypothetical protein
VCVGRGGGGDGKEGKVAEVANKKEGPLGLWLRPSERCTARRTLAQSAVLGQRRRATVN